MAPSSPSSPACSLHIRLFDGTSIRSAFSPDSSLSSAVRSFVSNHSHTDQPYNFRLIAQPPRTIEISEESHSLYDLGLCPNATLVLVPVRDFTDAYASGGASGVLQKSIGTGWAMLGGIINAVATYAGRTVGYGVTEEPPSSESRDQSRINTLAGHRTNEVTEAYNGNQLSVEPRPSDEK